ncbi:MAG: hypothetical protein ACR2JU_00095 [Nocardioidaceae bacterium]
MTVRGAAYIDLSGVDGWHDVSAVRRRCADLALIPTGATLIVHVGQASPSCEAVRLIGEHVDRLTVEVHAAGSNVEAWLAALRGTGAIFDRRLQGVA